MANWLTREINKFLSEDESILDLCCGIGNVSDGFKCSKILGVDVFQRYLDIYSKNVPNSDTLRFDLSKISESTLDVFSDSVYDNVLCIDGVEHLEYEDSIKLIEKLEKIARKKIIIFTPENVENPDDPVLNHPKGIWGISGADQWQEHKSAFPRRFWQQRGYSVYQLNKGRNVYDKSFYYEMLYVKEK